MCLCIFVRLPSAVLNVAFILKFNSLTCTLIRLVIYQGLLNSLKSLFLIILTIILFCKEKASNTILRSTFLTLKDIHWKKSFKSFSLVENMAESTALDINITVLKWVQMNFSFISSHILLLHCICEAAWKQSN